MKHRGFEPRTTWLKVKCSTDWANAPYIQLLVLLWCLSHDKCPEPESNQRHRDFQSLALPTELSGQKKSCGGRIWTYDLRVMSPTSFQTAPPRDNYIILYAHFKETCNLFGRFFFLNGWRWIRTTESVANRFTVCPLWPLGNPSIKPINGLEPITCWLQISCSANWATSAYKLTNKNGTNRARTCDPLLVRQVLSQLSYDPML